MHEHSASGANTFAAMPSPEMQQVIDFLRMTAAPAGTVPTIEESRQALDAMAGAFPVPGDVTGTPLEVAGRPCERHTPESPEDGLVLYLHGGAYVAGSLDSHRSLCARLAQATAREVLAVDYRLAPEHPFPAGLDDAVAVYRDVLASGRDAPQVVVAGDSAGGGLAAALLLRLRDERDPRPAGAVLLSPWLDLTMTADAVTSRAETDPMLREATLRRSAAAYAGEDLRHPLVSPVFADPAGLPPLLVLVGTAEILLDDSRTFAERAAAAGVEVECDVEDDMPHVWPAIDGPPESAAAMQRIGAWVRSRLGA